MIVLGIETTCDDTSLALVRDGGDVVACLTASQTEAHAVFAGVVPEVASRMHCELLLPTLKRLLQETKTSLSDIDAVAVASTPGLIGSLLVGVNSAKALAFSLEVPLVGVDHLMAHFYTIAMSAQVSYPHLGLLASGGHTLVGKVHSPLRVEVLATTVDDAAGECFDKIAKHLQLGFPGGPAVEAIAKDGFDQSYSFPQSRVKKGEEITFTFSGLKTAVIHQSAKFANKRFHSHDPEKIERVKSLQEKANIAASFQKAALSQLVEKTLMLAKMHKVNSIGICGGVACNQELRKQFSQAAKDYRLVFPSPLLCSDNAAMIAGLGFHSLKANKALHPFEINTKQKSGERVGNDNFFNFSPNSQKVRMKGWL